MNTRALTEEEKASIIKLYENPFKFKIGEFIGYSIISLVILSTILLSLEKLIGNLAIINLKSISISSICIGLISAFLKYKNRNQLFHRAFSRNDAVKIYICEINRYVKTTIHESKYTSYICEISKTQTLHFLSDSDLGETLSKKIKIEVIQLEAPLVLKASNCSSHEKAVQIEPTNFLVGLLEELAEFEFNITDDKFETFFE